MTAIKCPTFSKLLDFSEEKLAASSRRRVDHHLKGGCIKCREKMEWFSQHSQLTGALHLQNPPEKVVASALSLFRQKGPGVKSWIRIASSFETPEDFQLHGVRAMDAGSQQKSLETSFYKISLMLACDKAELTLAGQLEAKSAIVEVAHCLVEIVSGKKNMRSTLTNERGEFLFPGLHTKDFELRIHGEPDSVLIVFDSYQSAEG
ncbi:hypothetical protein L0222_31425 [bacterium]|nr:hypothetical protein [bacterium]MCI0606064.1 hypothetical protein [bacterium]